MSNPFRAASPRAALPLRPLDEPTRVLLDLARARAIPKRAEAIARVSVLGLLFAAMVGSIFVDNLHGLFVGFLTFPVMVSAAWLRVYLEYRRYAADLESYGYELPPEHAR